MALRAMVPSAVWQLFEDPNGEMDRNVFRESSSASSRRRTACAGEPEDRAKAGGNGVDPADRSASHDTLLKEGGVIQRACAPAVPRAGQRAVGRLLIFPGLAVYTRAPSHREATDTALREQGAVRPFGWRGDWPPQKPVCRREILVSSGRDLLARRASSM